MSLREEYEEWLESFLKNHPEARQPETVKYLRIAWIDGIEAGIGSEELLKRLKQEDNFGRD